MIRHRFRALPSSAALVVAIAACAPPDAGRPDASARAFLEVVHAEDARRGTGTALEALLEATGAPWPEVRAAAVRGIGRLERPELAGYVEGLLDDDHPAVRAAAADALAQAHHRRDGTPALGPLAARAVADTDPAALAAVARSLGRLQVEGDARRRVASALVALSRGPGGAGDAPDALLVGVVLGMESLARAPLGPVPAVVTARARELSRLGRTDPAPSTDRARIRALTTSTVALAGGLGAADVEGGLRDRDAEVRRTAAAQLRRLPVAVRGELVRRALLDPSAPVRWEGVAAVAAGPRDALACTRLLAAAERDEDTGVRLAALDALAVPCPEAGASSALLADVASRLPAGAGPGWHEPAHALAALAALQPARADGLLTRFVEHPDPFVRAWGARAATRAGNAEALVRLATDPDANVRTASLSGLAALDVERARAVALAALVDADDSQLLMTAAQVLESADSMPDAPRFEAAAGALDRLTTERSMTRRDARMALLGLMAETGGTDRLEVLEPYLRDYDPAVAARAGAAMTAWSGSRFMAVARPSPRLPYPTLDDLRSMQRSQVVLHMARGGEIVIDLLPTEAPTNAFRFFSMARDRAVEGLTFHRVAPNFVIQGLSPAANEYAGWGEYTRDEVGATVQWRGTVGVSTRGRDTGDGQIYVNLAHNTRLDHDYTILGRVVNGMEVVDAVLEGDVVERVEVRPLR
ncbi:MAG: peptidylprolyl isomerase [Longimicrobiales bacterium]